MSYLTQSQIAVNTAMRNRVAQCAVSEDYPGDADQWAAQNARVWSASPGWDDAWEYALAVHLPSENPDPMNPGEPYDPGLDETVITDGMILSAVQPMVKPPPPPEMPAQQMAQMAPVEEPVEEGPIPENGEPPEEEPT